MGAISLKQNQVGGSREAFDLKNEGEGLDKAHQKICKLNYWQKLNPHKVRSSLDKRPNNALLHHPMKRN